MPVQSPITAFLRPSAAATWTVCSGYVRMRAAYPEAPEEADTEIREQGLACHALAHSVYRGIVPALDSISANNVVHDEEMFDAVDMYLDVIRAWPVPAILEQPVSCKIIHPNMPDGTPDAWAWDATSRTLYVADLKYGFRFVEVWENPQLLCYARALIAHLNIDGLTDQNSWVEFVVVQPRSYHAEGPVRRWRVRMSDLRAMFNWLTSKAYDALSANAPCTPNPGCTDCPARHACSALQQAALTALHHAYDSVPHEVDAAGVGDELRRLKFAEKLLKARINGLEAQAEGMLRQGKPIPHWQMGFKKGREQIRPGEEQAVINLGRLLGVDLAAPRKPLTPAQIRKRLPNPEVLEPFVHHPNSGAALMPVDKFSAKKAFTR